MHRSNRRVQARQAAERNCVPSSRCSWVLDVGVTSRSVLHLVDVHGGGQVYPVVPIE